MKQGEKYISFSTLFLNFQWNNLENETRNILYSLSCNSHFSMPIDYTQMPKERFKFDILICFRCSLAKHENRYQHLSRFMTLKSFFPL